MSHTFRITVRILDESYHGRGDGGTPEWPPSPLRLFQALIAASAARWNERMVLEYALPALEWLERLPPPMIVAPPGIASKSGYKIYVPNNAADLVAAAWRRGNIDANISEHRTQKPVRAVHLLKGSTVHFDFPLDSKLDGSLDGHIETISSAARSITHLGWGIDMVAGNAELLTEEQASALKGEVWRPAADNSGTPLRVPIGGTLVALMKKHAAFLGRLSKEGFKPVPPLAAFKVVSYRRATDAETRPWCAFAILKPDASGNQAFDTSRRARDVAAWVRHATSEVYGDAWGDRASFVHGHGEDGKQAKGEGADARFQFLPLPTINHALNRVESIRRVLIAAPPQCKDRIDFIKRRMPGQELMWDGRPIGILNILPTSDWVLKQYTGTANVWSTVTPVILPGHDDRDSDKAETLLRRAFVQAGLSQELVDGICELEWRHVGFRAGLDLAKNYRRPENLNGPTYHVRVRFAHPVKGPLAIGAGRYRGFGLFAAEE